MENTVCAGVLDCVYDFQNLLSGSIAIVAAAIGAWALFRSANAPVVAAKQLQNNLNRRRGSFGCSRMAVEFERVAGLAYQAKGTIRATIGARKDVSEAVRAKTTLPIPGMLDDWEFMSLLSPETLQLTHEVRLAIEGHNFDIARAGGSFGSDDFQKHVLERAEKVHRLATKLSSQFHGEARRFNLMGTSGEPT